jgi:platelet-activating factor acetylhydrolase IB subunit beta/gamma
MLIALLAAAALSMSSRVDCVAGPPPDAAIVRAKDQRWLEKERSGQLGSRTPQLVMLGDSLIATLSDPEFQSVWAKYYAPYEALNLGVGGDTTANVLWRIKNGALDNLSPKAVIVEIGTNDEHCQWSVAHTVDAIGDIIHEVHSRLPSASIVLEGNFPRARSDRPSEVNASLVERFSAMQYVTFIDTSPLFLDQDRLRQDLFLGSAGREVHPNPQGADSVGDCIAPVIKRLMAPSDAPGPQRVSAVTCHS